MMKILVVALVAFLLPTAAFAYDEYSWGCAAYTVDENNNWGVGWGHGVGRTWSGRSQYDAAQKALFSCQSGNRGGYRCVLRQCMQGVNSQAMANALWPKQSER